MVTRGGSSLEQRLDGGLHARSRFPSGVSQGTIRLAAHRPGAGGSDTSGPQEEATRRQCAPTRGGSGGGGAPERVGDRLGHRPVIHRLHRILAADCKAVRSIRAPNAQARGGQQLTASAGVESQGEHSADHLQGRQAGMGASQHGAGIAEGGAPGKGASHHEWHCAST